MKGALVSLILLTSISASAIRAPIQVIRAIDRLITLSLREQSGAKAELETVLNHYKNTMSENEYRAALSFNPRWQEISPDPSAKAPVISEIDRIVNKHGRSTNYDSNVFAARITDPTAVLGGSFSPSSAGFAGRK